MTTQSLKIIYSIHGNAPPPPPPPPHTHTHTLLCHVGGMDISQERIKYEGKSSEKTPLSGVELDLRS